MPNAKILTINNINYDLKDENGRLGTASEFSTSLDYVIGDYCWYEDKLYRFTTNHSSSTWVAAHAMEVKIMDEIKNIDVETGTPVAVATAADMTDQSTIYLYTGSETGYTTNHWYYYNGTAWVDGGLYGSSDIEVDSALSSSSTNSVQNKVITGEITKLKNDTTELKSFFYISKNMVNPATIVVGEYVNQTNGNFYSNNTHARTDYIEVSPSTTYVARNPTGAFGDDFRYVFYTASKAYISGDVGALPDMLLTSPANAKYLVFSNIVPTDLGNWMLAPYADGDKSFVAYNNSYILPQYVQVDADLANTIVTGKNLYDVSTEISGYYINVTNGQLAENTYSKASDYIPVEPSTTYVVSTIDGSLNDNLRYACYDLNKIYISGQKSNDPFTTPANAAYVRFSLSAGESQVQLEKGSTPTSYEPYQKILNPNMVWSKDTQENVNDAIDASDVSCGFSTLAESEDAHQITEYADTDLTWTVGVKYFNGTVYTGGSYDSYHYTYFDNLVEGDVIYSEIGTFRDVCAFNGDSVVSSAGSNNPGSSYIVPAGINKIAVTRGVNTVPPIFKDHIYSQYYIKEIALLKNFDDALDANLATKSAWVDPDDTTFFHITPNMIDPDECTNDTFVNQATGVTASSNNHTCSDYIPVDASTAYYLMIDQMGGTSTSDIRIAFYTSTKVFISGQLFASSVSGTITSPATAAYARVSMFTGNNASRMMLALYDENNLTFESYSNNYILPQYIKAQEGIDAVINLPAKVYALVGYELNIYFENLVEDWTKYHWDVTCSKGMQLERGFRVTPTADDVGTVTLSIKITDEYGKAKIASTSLIITAASARSGESDSVIILGDSTTNNGIAVTKLNANFADDVMSISTLGTRGTGPNFHEGRSGWKFSDYFTVESETYTDGRGTVYNPWYNPSTQTFDADHYFTETSVSKPDWFFINLGINDTFGYGDDTSLATQITNCKNYCDAMIASMNDASPNTKIGVCMTIPPNHSQDAFGKAYKNSQTRNRYKRNNVLWVSALISEYDNREEEGIYLIPIYTNLDTVYNMGMETLPVNARNTSITYESPIANGGVHPVESGYWQIADVYTAFLKAQA